jgi:hypothetical protein
MNTPESSKFLSAEQIDANRTREIEQATNLDVFVEAIKRMDIMVFNGKRFIGSEVCFLILKFFTAQDEQKKFVAVNNVPNVYGIRSKLKELSGYSAASAL